MMDRRTVRGMFGALPVGLMPAAMPAVGPENDPGSAASAEGAQVAVETDGGAISSLVPARLAQFVAPYALARGTESSATPIGPISR